jgi:hypothetical protein
VAADDNARGVLGWPGVAEAGSREREVTLGGVATVEGQSLISSVPPSRAGAAKLPFRSRGGWGIAS